MNGLDSSFEALAFIPVNLGPLLSATVNNLWAWLAVITAAFSYWRLRSSSSSSSSHVIFPPPPPTPTEPTPTTSFDGNGIAENSENVDDEEDKEDKEEERVLTRGNSKKFFTVFEEDRENDQDDDEDNHDNHDDDEMDGQDEVEEEKNEWVVIKRWGSSSELTVEMRGGDLGWYSYQNRKVIDGSVVRLWREERESVTVGKNFVYSPRKLSATNSF